MYNRDRDSLAEYEFKIGTYASFDRGRHWADLGQLNTCPQAQAPPSSWPLNNTCYPADDPNRAGTGPEDSDDGRPGGDYGEEYITSDVWTDFDDEGNAYAMVLDSPPFPSGNGWGMSFHRWETPSARDIRRGRTWSRRIPINAYPTLPDQSTKLDDKNTFAVNNAGRDHDGKTGIIVACWGQNYELDLFGRQAEVCERSTRRRPQLARPAAADLAAARSGVAVRPVRDRRARRRQRAGPEDVLRRLARHADRLPRRLRAEPVSGSRRRRTAPRRGSRRRIIGRITQLPNVFPRQSFRNLSLPIMAAGKHGELYVTYADYNPAPDPGSDEDGMQADIKLLRSFDGGATWSNAAGQSGQHERRPVPALRARDATRAGERVVLRPAPRQARPAEPPGQLLHRHVPRAVQQRREHVEGDPALARPRGIRRSTRRSPGRASSSATTRGWSPTTASRSRSSTTPTWPTIRVATRTSTRASRAARIQEIIAWRVPNTRAFGGVGGHQGRHGHCRRGGRRLREAQHEPHRRHPRDDRPVVEASDPAGPDPARGPRGQGLPHVRPVTLTTRPAPARAPAAWPHRHSPSAPGRRATARRRQHAAERSAAAGCFMAVRRRARHGAWPYAINVDDGDVAGRPLRPPGDKALA